MSQNVKQWIFLPEAVFEAVLKASDDHSVRQMVDWLFWRALRQKKFTLTAPRTFDRPVEKISILIEQKLQSELFQRLGLQFYDLAFALGNLIETCLLDRIGPDCPDLTIAIQKLVILPLPQGPS